jgi:DedD protein
VDAAVKERLTGAIILVALIVLLVPALLTGPLRPAARGAAAPAEEPPLRTYTIDLADNARPGATAVRSPAPAPPPVAAPAASPPKAAQPPPAQTTPIAPVPAPAATHRATPTPAPAARATPATPRAGWTVQLGSFAHQANAEHLAAQLRQRGFQVGVSRATTGRRLYRVRAGPVSNRTEAERLAAKLRSSGYRGAVVAK